MKRIKNNDSIEIIRTPEKVKFNVSYTIRTNLNEFGRVSCFIDTFELVFQAQNDEEVINKSKWMLKSYVDYFFENSKEPLYGTNLWLDDLGFKYHIEPTGRNDNDRTIYVKDYEFTYEI